MHCNRSAGKGSLENIVLAQGNALVLQCLLVALEPVQPGGEVGRACNDSDFLVAQVQEVPGHVVGPLKVVTDNIVEVGALELSVNQDHRKALGNEPFHHWLLEVH